MRQMILWLSGLMLLTLGSLAAAHLTPNSELLLDFRQDAVVIDAIIPEGDYRLTSGATGARNPAAAARWLAGQVAATAPDGRAWAVRVVQAEFVQRAGPPDLHAIIRMTPPQGASPRRFTLRWTAVVGQNPDHFALLLVGNDHGANVLASDRRLIGAVRGERTTIAIDRGVATTGAAFKAAFRLGMHHIAGGTDHLLFLLTLLLPAPLLAAGGWRDGRWNGPRPALSAVARLATIITAFTIGHSLTLMIAALAGWSLPVAPVEVAIALSILVAAIHALRPIFPGRETWVAAGFGLIHGLAFATLVGDAGIGGSDRLLAILGFNLGIEVVQLGVAAMAFVPLMLIARTPTYRWVRIAAALFAGVAALAWVIERSTGEPNRVAGVVALLANHAIWLLAVLIALALFAGLSRRTANGTGGGAASGTGSGRMN